MRNQLARITPRLKGIDSGNVRTPWKRSEVTPKRLTGRAGVERRFRIKVRDGFTCQRCGRTTEELEIDHIVPLAVSGDDSDSNLQSLCVDCHAIKTIADRAL